MQLLWRAVWGANVCDGSTGTDQSHTENGNDARLAVARSLAIVLDAGRMICRNLVKVSVKVSQ